ncbi:hypothetical protein [Streptomyces sp. RKAG293]|uniref:hypothetical protein n=1 Tax=Streptomyces sp. RKAG293 TaxID=2893403 RepID=UPI00203376F2|nr:hypothetical protein [Streptomyces sp. RKAG293]MCM2424186.1 hypothetical protein [Streptomyces sp. RKAG293]
MSNTPQHDVDHALAYPEPPASPLWHRDPQARPLTPEQQRRNRELLAADARTRHLRTHLAAPAPTA